MNPIERLDSHLGDRLADLGGTSPDYIDDILGRTARTRQRPAWTFRGRWLPMIIPNTRQVAASPLPWHTVRLWLMVGLLAAALAGGATFVAGSLGMLGPRPNDGPTAFNAVALPPTACTAGEPLTRGSIATIAGTGVQGSTGDGGAAIAATIDASYSGVGVATIAVDGPGAIYFTEPENGLVRRIDIDGLVTTFVGPDKGGAFLFPMGLAFDTSDDLFVADAGNLQSPRIWKIDPRGRETVVVGNGHSGSTGDEGPAIAAMIQAAWLTIGPNGDLYLDDLNGYRVVDPAGIIHAFAGRGAVAGYSGDGGPATAATFGGEASGVAADQLGNVYIGDPGNHRIRKVDPSGTISTVAGTGVAGFSGDGGPGIQAELDTPGTLAVDALGNVYFADPGNSTVRRIDTAGIITTVAGTGVAGYSGDCGSATQAQLNQPSAVAVHDEITYIVDAGNDRIRMVVP